MQPRNEKHAHDGFLKHMQIVNPYIAYKLW